MEITTDGYYNSPTMLHIPIKGQPTPFHLSITHCRYPQSTCYTKVPTVPPMSPNRSIRQDMTFREIWRQPERMFPGKEYESGYMAPFDTVQHRWWIDNYLTAMLLRMLQMMLVTC